MTSKPWFRRSKPTLISRARPPRIMTSSAPITWPPKPACFPTHWSRNRSVAHRDRRGRGSLDKGADQRVASPLESGPFRLKQRSKEKSVTGQFDGAHLTVRSGGANFQSAIHQGRRVSGIGAKAAVIGLANLIDAVDLAKPASRRQLQGFVHLNQGATSLPPTPEK